MISQVLYLPFCQLIPHIFFHGSCLCSFFFHCLAFCATLEYILIFSIFIKKACNIHQIQKVVHTCHLVCTTHNSEVNHKYFHIMDIIHPQFGLWNMLCSNISNALVLKVSTIFRSCHFFNQLTSLFAYFLYPCDDVKTSTNVYVSCMYHCECHQWRWEWYGTTNIVFCKKYIQYHRKNSLQMNH